MRVVCKGAVTYLQCVGPTHTIHLCSLKSTGFIYPHKLIIIIVIVIVTNTNKNNNGTSSCSICFTSSAYLVTIWNPLWNVSAAGRMKGQKRADRTDGSRVTLQAFGPFPCYFMEISVLKVPPQVKLGDTDGVFTQLDSPEVSFTCPHHPSGEIIHVSCCLRCARTVLILSLRCASTCSGRLLQLTGSAPSCCFWLCNRMDSAPLGLPSEQPAAMGTV